uniref:Uncharacterized protein n=1 Tax=Romanomermis culicivorax TaxID=13658 RepID=A0A915HNZ9_ROMCU
MIGMSSLRSELTGNHTLIETCTLRVDNYRSTTKTTTTLAETTTTPTGMTTTLAEMTTTLAETTTTLAETTTTLAENAAATKAYDMTLPMAVFCSTAGLVVLFFILTFRPKLRRLNLENDQRRAAQGASKNLLSTNRMEEKSLEQEMLDLSQLKKQKRQEFLNSTT